MIFEQDAYAQPFSLGLKEMLSQQSNLSSDSVRLYQHIRRKDDWQGKLPFAVNAALRQLYAEQTSITLRGRTVPGK